MKLNTCPECGHYPTSHDKDGCMVGRQAGLAICRVEHCPCKRTREEAIPKEWSA